MTQRAPSSGSGCIGPRSATSGQIKGQNRATLRFLLSLALAVWRGTASGALPETADHRPRGRAVTVEGGVRVSSARILRFCSPKPRVIDLNGDASLDSLDLGMDIDPKVYIASWA